MKVVVISHKECWASLDSPSGYSTIGGFPFQMQAVSELFDETILVTLARHSAMPCGAKPLLGSNLSVRPLDEPAGVDLRRKVALLFWLPRNLPHIWREIRAADGVHALVPGDLGTIGILIALAQRKPLFVRHCGTWGQPVTAADRFLLWLLQSIAGGRNVVMATGGAEWQPSQKNRSIKWIFSTTLSKKELSAIPDHKPWQPGEHLKLVTVGRLTAGKNTESVIRALPLIRNVYADVSLDVVGDGPCLNNLKQLVRDLDLVTSVTFHGNLSHENVMKVLSSSHLFVFPTRVKEGFPKAVLEALACGLPVIATAISVIPQLIGNRNGLLLQNTDQLAVAEAVTQLISDDRALAEMSVSARETSHAYTLERWREVIGNGLRVNWGSIVSANIDGEPHRTFDECLREKFSGA